MALTVEKVASDALGLPSAGRVELVEKLLASLAGHSDPAVERTHLDEVRRRRESVRTGQSQLIEGDEALRRARAALRQ
ncbi:MAG: addiction module protein [Verrucomicrobia bacterium]|nr:addiction module protein [Verrucomicrobiota bacterium]